MRYIYSYIYIYIYIIVYVLLYIYVCSVLGVVVFLCFYLLLYKVQPANRIRMRECRGVYRLAYLTRISRCICLYSARLAGSDIVGSMTGSGLGCVT